MDDTTSVAELLRRADGGDRAAWDLIVDRYTDLLWSVARSYRLDTVDAADVVQTTWLRLVENLGRIQDPERLPGWLATTARRECLRLLKRSQRELVGALDDTADDLPDTAAPELDDRLLRDERDAALWRCFLRLTPRCQQLLRVLTATDAPAYAQVAEALDMPIGSIGPTRMRCLHKLRLLTAEAGHPVDSPLGGSAR